ncbi:MAG: glutamate---cysteine ligase / carboxylate-amine ligase [Miltoncostaeaceae bacterium]|nr:glutamate---cysteine ligase / carboxylate-amine ligase [Miltoncostaeaceae bacterium]
MLLRPSDWWPSQESDAVLERLSPALRRRLSAETHASAIEFQTGVHRTVADAMGEVRELRAALAREIGALGIRPAAAGIHPLAAAGDSTISHGDRYQRLASSLRALAVREPTYALHVHVGVPTASGAIRVMNRLRAHLPLLLALSANSPFWRGQDSGLASMRTPLFQAFPRTGLPRSFRSYEDYVTSIDQLIRCGGIPGPSFLWWDMRLQPGLGTLEVRIMDVQIESKDTAPLVALVQCLARAELEEGLAPPALVDAPEILAENRFLAARDGMAAALIDPTAGGPVPVRRLLDQTLAACEDHARALGCSDELAAAERLGQRPGASRQRILASGPDGLQGLLVALADAFAEAPAVTHGAPREAAGGIARP